jgi:hypothetical protein
MLAIAPKATTSTLAAAPRIRLWILMGETMRALL